VAIFGFLSTGDDVIPGNYGHWDQIQALKWVQENIAAFGGDPTRVTIYGQSAGAISVSTLFLSPQATGLFHNVIAESSTMIVPWQQQADPLPYAVQVAEIVDCPADNSTVLLSCLQNRTTEQIQDAYMEVAYFPTLYPIYFSTVIDGEGGVLPDEPVNIIQNDQYNKVPYLNGLTQNEGLIFFSADESVGVVFDRDYITNHLDQLVHNITLLTGDELTQVTSLVYDEYFSQIDLDNNTAIAASVQAFISDGRFNFGTYQIMTLLPKGEDQPPAYTYVFTYSGEFAPFPGTTTHTDELPYIFDIADDNGGILNAQDNVTSQRILTLWTTFAKTGNPNPTTGDVIQVTWDAVTSSDSIPYLNIDVELSMEEDFRKGRLAYWNNTILPVINSYSESYETHKL